MFQYLNVTALNDSVSGGKTIQRKPYSYTECSLPHVEDLLNYHQIEKFRGKKSL